MGAYAHYDDEADEMEEGVIIDLDKEGEIVGITITGRIKQRFKEVTIKIVG